MAILGSYKSKHTGQEIDDAVDNSLISVPNTRQINGKPLKNDILLNYNDVGAIAQVQGSENANKIFVTDEYGNQTLVEKKPSSIGAVATNQGSENANKLFMTDEYGNQTLASKLPSVLIPDTGVSVDSAKNLELADGSLMSSTDVKKGINTSLYNLGAYDTASGNVITRKTGYFEINDNTCSFAYYDSYCVVVPLTDIKTSSNMLVKCNRLSSVYDSDVLNNIYKINSSDNNFAIIGPNMSMTSDSWKSFLRQAPLYIQYELSISYIENVIEGQPLITLDQQGSSWLKEEWENGLNLLDSSLFDNRTEWNISGNSTSSFYIMLYYTDTYAWSDATCQFTLNTSSPYGRNNFTFTVDGRNNGKLYGVIGINGNVQDDKNLFEINLSAGIYVFSAFLENASLDRYNVKEFMITKGEGIYPYQPYNSNRHITIEEANFLKEDFKASLNLFDGITMSTGTTDSNGKPTDLTVLTRVVTNPYVKVKPNTTYIVDTNADFIIYEVNFFDGNNNTISLNVINKSSYTFTTPSNCYYIVVLFRKNLNDGQIIPNEVKENATLLMSDTPYRRLNVYEVDFVKEENLKSANLYSGTQLFSGELWSRDITEITNFINSLSVGTYTISLDIYGSSTIENKDNSNGVFSFIDLVDTSDNSTVMSSIYDNHYIGVTGTFSITFIKKNNVNYMFRVWGCGNHSVGSVYNVEVDNIIINKGTVVLPYQEFEGSIIRQKQLEEEIEAWKIMFNSLQNNYNALNERVSKLEGQVEYVGEQIVSGIAGTLIDSSGYYPVIRYNTDNPFTIDGKITKVEISNPERNGVSFSGSTISYSLCGAISGKVTSATITYHYTASTSTASVSEE